MLKLLLVLLLSLPYLASSQNTPAANSGEKSIKPILQSSITWAVVIGISDYQDPAIPDLRYAHRDAEAFANFLRSPVGGSLNADHLKVLTNNQATAGHIAEALDALVEQAQEGDKVIIYFSGHGDVERKTVSQPGFLLCWDSPSQVYMGGGTYSLAFLQEILTTLSTQNKAKVWFVADACHAGKLAGSQIGGAQATSANLAKQYANEIKILSCQPNEFSIEGEQWGGGRGVFSYHFVDGLYGLADGNGDRAITLMEMGRHLEDRVSTEVAPIGQMPLVLGNRAEKLADVDSRILADLRSGKLLQMANLSAIDSRGLEDEVLAGVDTSIRELYRLFKQALHNKQFLEPQNTCANYYYEKLAAEPGLARLHSTMRRNFAACLQDDAQQVMNTMLKTGLTPEVLKAARAGTIYKNYPAYLEKSAALLGKEHYMYATLQARKCFFEGKIKRKNQDKKSAFFQALQWQTELPHAYVELIHTYTAEQADSAFFYANKAISAAPGWVLPYVKLASFSEFQLGQIEKADSLLNLASKLDSNAVIVWYEKARFYQRQWKLEASEHWFKKVISSAAEGICFPCAHNEFGYTYLYNNQISEAEQEFKQAIQLDSTVANFHNSLAALYLETKRYLDAEQPVRTAIKLDSTFVNAYINLAHVFNASNRYLEAERTIKLALQLDSSQAISYYHLAVSYVKTNRAVDAENVVLKLVQRIPSAESYYYLARIQSIMNQIDKSFESLEKSLKIEASYYEYIVEDPELVPLRARTEQWKALMKKYFPDKVKD
ncbi:MAG: caspase family protein [Lewinellaceae bacterium]|nr:caspase family protein [Lewinellaceae bacterium]